MLDHRERVDAPSDPGTRPPEHLHPGRDDLKQRLERLADLHPSSPDYPTVEQHRSDGQRADRRTDRRAESHPASADDRDQPGDRALAAPMDAARSSDGTPGGDARQGGDKPGGPPAGPEPSDSRDEPERQRTGWDAPDVRDHPKRPEVSEIHLPDGRGQHLLDGAGPDAEGGGHRHGTGRPGKTEFPRDWSDDVILRTVENIARKPDVAELQPNGRWRVTGDHDGVTVTAVVLPDGRIWTAWPEPGGKGVTQNPGA